MARANIFDKFTPVIGTIEQWQGFNRNAWEYNGRGGGEGKYE